MNIQRTGTTRRYSDIVVHQGVAYIVEVPSEPEDDFYDQTIQVLSSIDYLLATCGSRKSNLLMATIYLSDMANYDAFNSIWDQWIPEGKAPVRACVEACLSDSRYQIEISLTAAVEIL